ncbi:MAG TPA: hypothetical protein VHO73_00180 [Methylomirabilota bacterium]|jgi:hypothetical protein|nr:hypothetical protein [Methylomirabilota bacterium]
MTEGGDGDPGRVAVALAREAIERYVRTGLRLAPLPDLPPLLNAPALRGVLLPGIAGGEAPAQQVVFARIKARIGPEDPVRLFRFRARR